ncbi:MAG: hypothetical protein KL863_25225 [Rhizobium sp.]|nr:hypothetical protein [Rhizobium sp.]
MAVVTVFTASIGIALAGVASVLLFGQWLSSFLSGQSRQPQPARAYARTRRPEQDDPRQIRVWNDGKGTIIDMWTARPGGCATADGRRTVSFRLFCCLELDRDRRACSSPERITISPTRT